MYMTILSGKVAPENRTVLESTYQRAVRHTPDGLLHSFLVQAAYHSHTWKIVSIWRSEESFDLAQQAGLLEPCVQVFCEGGNVPERTGYHVVEEFQRV